MLVMLVMLVMLAKHTDENQPQHEQGPVVASTFN
jgi:hypothetical protein